MRQAIRVYAIVALALLGAYLAVLWAFPTAVTSLRSWLAVVVLVAGAQLWVLLVIPLGVLAAAAAAHAGRRGWLAAFVVLLVLAPTAAGFEPLVIRIQALLVTRCVACFAGSSSGGQFQLLYMAGWAVALLPVPLASLLYTLVPAGDTSHIRLSASTGQRRLIVACAIIGAVVMGALGYLLNSAFILVHFGSGTVEHILFIGALENLLEQVWFTLLDALPVAVASLALAHTIRAGQRVWLAVWIAIIMLAMPVANLYALTATIALFSPPPAPGTGPADVQLLFQVISAVVSVVVMLLALIYALIMMQPARPEAVALAA